MSQQMDIVNEHDEVIGQSDIQQILKKGVLHRSVHLFIINSHGKLFCRQRSFKKGVYPGYWTTSVGAHVMAGPAYDEVATESLRKVLGIHCPLTMIGKVRVQDEFENHKNRLLGATTG